MLQTHLKVLSPLHLDVTKSMYFPEKPNGLEKLFKISDP